MPPWAGDVRLFLTTVAISTPNGFEYLPHNLATALRDVDGFRYEFYVSIA